MLRIITSMSQLNPEQLMAVYLESNQENGKVVFTDSNSDVQLRRAEDSFLTYLREDFFCQPGAFYAVWVADGVYKSALRMEPYLDGFLVEALETAPADRRKGYASDLVRAVLAFLRTKNCNTVYSHVSKRNQASLKLHLKCGFVQISDSAVYIDGTVTQNSVTLCYNL